MALAQFFSFQNLKNTWTIFFPSTLISALQLTVSWTYSPAEVQTTIQQSAHFNQEFNTVVLSIVSWIFFSA